MSASSKRLTPLFLPSPVSPRTVVGGTLGRKRQTFVSVLLIAILSRSVFVYFFGRSSPPFVALGSPPSPLSAILPCKQKRRWLGASRDPRERFPVPSPSVDAARSAASHSARGFAERTKIHVLWVACPAAATAIHRMQGDGATRISTQPTPTLALLCSALLLRAASGQRKVRCVSSLIPGTRARC